MSTMLYQKYTTLEIAVRSIGNCNTNHDRKHSQTLAIVIATITPNVRDQTFKIAIQNIKD